LYDARILEKDKSGGTFFVRTNYPSNGRGCEQPVLINSRATQGRGQCYTFPYYTFERAILSGLLEIDRHDVLNGRDGPDESLALASQLASVEAQIAKLEKELEDGNVAALARVVRKLEIKQGTLARQLADVRQKAAHPLSETWGEAKSLIEALDTAPDPEDARLRLRTALRRIVDNVLILVVARGPDRLCVAQVNFADTDCFRSFSIFHRPPRNNGKQRTEGRWASWDTLVAPEQLVDLPRRYFGPFDAHDLRDPQEREWAEQSLRGFPKDILDQLFEGGQPLP